jgi:hypothetical protein
VRTAGGDGSVESDAGYGDVSECYVRNWKSGGYVKEGIDSRLWDSYRESGDDRYLFYFYNYDDSSGSLYDARSSKFTPSSAIARLWFHVAN